MTFIWIYGIDGHQCPAIFTKLNLSRYCTRLGQAQTEEDKTAVLEDMRNTPDAQAVLEA